MNNIINNLLIINNTAGSLKVALQAGWLASGTGSLSGLQPPGVQRSAFRGVH